MKHQSIRKTILFVIFFLVPIIMNVFSPVVIIISSLEGVAGITFYAWTIMFISSFFVGRAFCAYVCPYSGLQTVVYEVSKRELVKSKWMKQIRLSIGVIWLGMILFFIIKAGGLTHDFWFRFETKISVDDIKGVIRYYMIIGGALTFILMMGRSSFCKYICPMSILNTIGNRVKNMLGIPSLRLIANSGCVDCGKCTEVCTMSLDVNEMVRTGKMDDDDCVLCGECTSVCSEKVLRRELK